MSSGSSVAHAEVGSWVYFHEAFQDLKDFQQIRPESAVLQRYQFDARADAIFATLKAIVDDEKSTISSTISLRVAWP